MIDSTSVLGAIRDSFDQMFSAERKVAQFILDEPEKAVLMNVSEIANASDVSDATVVRMCKHIGYSGYYQMKIHLSHELGRNILQDKQRNGKPKTVKDMLEIQAASLLDLAKLLDMKTLLSCAELIQQCTNVHVVAVGHTMPVAMDLGFRLARMGKAATYFMIPEHFLSAINNAKEGELLIAISRSGSSRQVLQAAELAQGKGMNIIAITARQNSPLSKFGTQLILTMGENGLFGENYSPASHLCEMVVNDLLIHVLDNWERIVQKNGAKVEEKEIDMVEYILSEYKL